METSKLKKFAQYARRNLIEQVGSKLSQVLSDESPAGREHPEAVAKLKQKIANSDKTQVIEQVAYTWFNRFCALRFMDVNEYSRIMVVTPLSGQFQPEILAEAKAGHIDGAIVHEKTREKIFNLLNGTEISRDPQSEAYRLLVVAVCNDYHRIMPYLFERIEDYTELLMPDDLLSGNSILAYTREAMTPDACETVECIGWLYQFYISEKKDDVFAGLKKNIKITPENIPAATQLFTPHWIVRYLVENSLGRLWMLNNPESSVIEQMDYYIKPVEVETDFLKISSPEELKICDPACGSGHMLTYAFDLLYAIYLDDGRVDPADIPEKILSNNLYGIEIDERASELAAFALTMKAVKGNPFDEGNNRRRFFRNPVKPNICRIEKVEFLDDELDSYIDFVGKDLFTQDLRATLKQFDEADNFGSLIQPVLKSPQDALLAIQVKDVSGQLFLTETHKSVLKVLEQADYLRQKYHIVVANPPYMGGKGMNLRMTKWLKDNYFDFRSDLFSAFIYRNSKLALPNGQLGFMTPFVWMFISSYEKLRKYLVSQKTITSLIQLEYSGFDGATVPICTFTIENCHRPKFKGGFVRLSDFKGAAKQAPKALEAIQKPDCGWFYRSSADDFNKIPGSPIAYWMSREIGDLFENNPPLSATAPGCIGMMTTDNDKFLRRWWEVSLSSISFSSHSIDESVMSGGKWFPYSKGGSFRKWSGNKEYVVNWENEGEEIKGNGMTSFRGKNFYFRQGVTWSDVTSGNLSCRKVPEGFIHDISGHSVFPERVDVSYDVLAFMNTNFCRNLAKILNPTLHFQVGDYSKLPHPQKYFSNEVTNLSKEAVKIADEDWDASEIAWGYKSSPFWSLYRTSAVLSSVYDTVRSSWESVVKKLYSIEEKNNQLFIDAYSLQDELGSTPSLDEITLRCNPVHRYKGDKTQSVLEEQLLLDSIKEFISYSLGCMFGRYSIDKEGLILASQGETLGTYLKVVPNPSFEPDDDNVIPLIDLELEKGKQEDWFEDDISERFKAFLKATFGTENYDENLRFIEDAIGKDIKKFFLRDFYTDHIKRYKKRPIYWLFSSPKGSFNALIYMHRYRSDTVSVVLNDYLREFRTKLEAKKESYEQTSISANAEPADKTKALKAIEKIKAVLEEVKDYERDTLYPLASQNIEIDLDDGVKHNYPLFGKALKKVTGLS